MAARDDGMRAEEERTDDFRNYLFGTLHPDAQLLLATRHKHAPAILLLSSRIWCHVAQAAHEWRPCPATPAPWRLRLLTHRAILPSSGALWPVASLFRSFALSRATEPQLMKQFSVQLALPAQNKPVVITPEQPPNFTTAPLCSNSPQIIHCSSWSLQP